MEKPQRETDRSVCKADSGIKAFRSEKKVLCKNVARGSEPRRAQRQLPVPYQGCVSTAKWRGLWRDEAREVGTARLRWALETMQRSEKKRGKLERN